MSIFGPIKSGESLEAQVQLVLERWLPTYLREVERQHGLADEDGNALGKLPLPRSWKRTNEFDKWPEDQIPAIIIISPGLTRKPTRHGAQYHATFSLAVAALISAREPKQARFIAGLYAAAIRSCILQRRSLGGYARGTDWITERYDDIRSSDSRNLASAQVVFEVEVADVTGVGIGPVTPSEPPIDPLAPFADWTTVQDGGELTVNNTEEVQP